MIVIHRYIVIIVQQWVFCCSCNLVSRLLTAPNTWNNPSIKFDNSKPRSCSVTTKTSEKGKNKIIKYVKINGKVQSDTTQDTKALQNGIDPLVESQMENNTEFSKKQRFYTKIMYHIILWS